MYDNVPGTDAIVFGFLFIMKDLSLVIVLSFRLCSRLLLGCLEGNYFDETK